MSMMSVDKVERVCLRIYLIVDFFALVSMFGFIFFNFGFWGFEVYYFYVSLLFLFLYFLGVKAMKVAFKYNPKRRMRKK